MNYQLATRSKRHPLSRPQLEVLRKLAAEGPCASSSRTQGVFVSGTAVAALERRGLVFRRPMSIRDLMHGDLVYEISEAGRRALDETHAHT